MALAPGMVLFTLGRFGSGVAEALMDVSLTVLLARAMPEELRAKVFAAFAAAWVLPSLVGPPVAGVLTEAVSWRAVFAVGVALLPLAWLLLRPSMRTATARPVPAAGSAAASTATAGRPASTAPSGLRRWPRRAWRPSSPAVRCSAGPDPGAPRRRPGPRRRSPAPGRRSAPSCRPGPSGSPTAYPRWSRSAAWWRPRSAPQEASCRSCSRRSTDFGPAAAGVSLTVTGLCWAAGSQVHGLDVVQRRVGPVRRLQDRLRAHRRRRPRARP